MTGATGLQRYPSLKRFEDLATTEPLKTYTTDNGLFTNEIFRLFEDSRGDIWISVIGDTINTILRWERATGTIHGYTTNDNLPPKNGATAYGEDRAGNIWLGFYSGGLYRFRSGKFESFTAEDGLPPGYIGNIFTDLAGRLWVATSSGGVIRIDNPTTEEKPRLANLTTRDGLSSNQATCTTEDRFGRIYISTGRGVNRLDLQTGRVKVFTKADGLPENIVRLCQRDASGALWFGTSEGLARYVPIAEEQSAPPPIFVADVRVNGAVVRKLSELGEVVITGLDLTSDQRQIQIDFFALGYGTGEALLYQYKLFGIDADWSEATALRTVNLNLSPGAYRFLVRAVNSNGEASPAPASVSFSIARPVWQRWWFLLSASMLFSLAIYAFYRYRIAQIIRLERVRTRIATDLHDDIGSSLSQIAILSEVVRQKVGDNGANKPLNLIAEKSREMVDSMSDIVWAINPQKDHLSDLVKRMRRFAGDTFESQEIAFSFKSPENLKDIGLGADIRREVYLIFKESVNNLAKYSKCKTAEIAINLAGDLLIVEISDDGCGFDVEDKIKNAAESYGGNGLPNMQRRAAAIGGKILIKSEFGQGTRITLRIAVGKKIFAA